EHVLEVLADGAVLVLDGLDDRFHVNVKSLLRGHRRRLPGELRFALFPGKGPGRAAPSGPPRRRSGNRCRRGARPWRPPPPPPPPRRRPAVVTGRPGN